MPLTKFMSQKREPFGKLMAGYGAPDFVNDYRPGPPTHQ